ncbi:YrrC family ATP-dependent DNA helicase [Nitrosomonas communis]|uniref:Exodeoxyribonuclease V alpha subunit n=1 Tax=Nitrosomonas communis TaxID=44574 RepID=A0A1I4VVX6_9PROT|nr:hypothetical protein [Nitrosomonas communis]SFN05498.1 exodeoxyribonuclease V alpha subunit [Nitrosomonas communis]
MNIPPTEYSADNTLEKLQGSVERVTFHSESSGFCVLRVKVKGQRELITVIGSAVSVTAGEYIECSGFWVNDRQHGQQFKTPLCGTMIAMYGDYLWLIPMDTS